jgi:hypothetical protein
MIASEVVLRGAQPASDMVSVMRAGAPEMPGAIVF